MRLRTRLALIVGFSSLAGGMALGVTFAYGTRNDATRQAEKLITDALDIVKNDPLKDPATLLEYVKASPSPLSVHLFFDQLPSIEVIQEMDGKYPVELPTLVAEDLDKATTAFRDFRDEITIRYRALEVEDGEWLVVATSLREIDDQFSSTLRRSILSSFFGALLITLIISQLIRRELKSVDEITRDAQSIAQGNLDVALPAVGRHTEISELSTSLRQMVDSLRHAIEVTTESESRMREFLGDASHELRTPLTVIKGYIDILNSGRDLSTGQMERAMRRLSTESNRMDSIINDLLLLAEIGEVQTDLHQDVDLSTVVRGFVADLREEQPDRVITEDIASNAKVEGNLSLLERLIANIVSNIRRHTLPTHAVKFSLAVDGDVVILTVDDAGPGLSEQMYTRATEGFQRFDRHRSAAGGGFGLGLSIISSIVSTHNGTLELNPSSDGGLRTRIVLPRAHKV